MKIGSIVIRCHEWDRMYAFWREALRYVPREAPTSDWVVLTDPKQKGPNVSLDRMPRKREGKRSWLHLDLYTDQRQQEVDRLVALGAKRYPWRHSQQAEEFTVLEDPDGNLFCVVQKDAK